MDRVALARGTLALVATMACAACTKGENAGGGTGAGSSPSGGTTSSVTPIPLASALPLPSASTAPSPSTAAIVTDDSAKVAASPTKDAKDAKDAGGATGPKVTSRVAGKNFALDLVAAGCKAGAECAMTIRLQAESGFHINKQYPYKFLANAEPSVTFLGKTAPTTFSRESGDFIEDGEKAGTMTVRFKPAAAGKAKVAGTYKLSVCSADQCQIEQEKLELVIPVL